MKKIFLIVTGAILCAAAYSQKGDNWEQKNDIGYYGINGPAPRYGAVAFSIAGKGYMGTGEGGSEYNDFWEYDPLKDAWTQKADFGGVARWGAVGFSIGNRGYIGTGDYYDQGYVFS